MTHLQIPAAAGLPSWRAGAERPLRAYSSRKNASDSVWGVLHWDGSRPVSTQVAEPQAQSALKVAELRGAEAEAAALEADLQKLQQAMQSILTSDEKQDGTESGSGPLSPPAARVLAEPESETSDAEATAPQPGIAEAIPPPTTAGAATAVDRAAQTRPAPAPVVRDTRAMRLQAEARDRRRSREKARKLRVHYPVTRDIPNTAVSALSGKPPFAEFGHANINPVNGGIVYGDYMYTHNISPEMWPNDPVVPQVYPYVMQHYVHRLQQKHERLQRSSGPAAPSGPAPFRPAGVSSARFNQPNLGARSAAHRSSRRDLGSHRADQNSRADGNTSFPAGVWSGPAEYFVQR